MFKERDNGNRYVPKVKFAFGLSAEVAHMRGSRGGQGGRDPLPLENCKVIEFLSNTGPNPLENIKATKPVFNVGPMMICFKWYSDPLFPHQLKQRKRRKKTLSKLS